MQQATQRLPISKPPSASPMALLNKERLNQLYNKPLRTEPASQSPISREYMRHLSQNHQEQKHAVVIQVSKKSSIIVDDKVDLPLMTPGGSILEEESLLAQKMPQIKYIKASGQVVRPQFINPQQFQIKNKDTGRLIYTHTLGDVIDARHYQIKGNIQAPPKKQQVHSQFLNLCLANLTEKCIDFLKNSGCDINQKDGSGNTALHMAVVNGNVHLVRLFLYHEAIIDSVNDEQQTPLMRACEYGHEEITSTLLTAGADINAHDWQLNTPLHLSVMRSHKRIVEQLLKRQSLMCDAKNRDHKSPLDLCTSGDIRKLLELESHPLRDEIQIHDKIGSESFIVHGLIGKGNFGEVYLVEKRHQGTVFAMKVLHKSKIVQQNLTKYAVTERNVLSITKHPFIVRLRYAFQTVDKLFLILDYCPGGDLGEHLQREKRFPEERVKLYMTQIILALEDLHKRDIIFRDLKPDNIVLDADGFAMLTDFGLSKEGVLEHHTGARSFCGSIAYLAPEMLKRCGHGKAVDWYLLGVVMYELLAGMPPYYAHNRDELFNNIERAALKIPSYVSAEGANLLKSLLQRNPAKRLGSGKGDAEEIKQHKYFKHIKWDEIYNKKIEMQRPTRKIKLSRLQDYNVFDQSSFVEPDRQHILGWSFVEQKQS